MHTTTVDQELSLNAMHLAGMPVTHPAVAPSVPLPSLLGKDVRTSTESSLHHETLSELDAMLIRDPNIGAVRGVRVAMMFNAGLVLSGLLGWELWTMLFR